MKVGDRVETIATPIRPPSTGTVIQIFDCLQDDVFENIVYVQLDNGQKLWFLERQCKLLPQ